MLQPRDQNPTGIIATGDRLAELTETIGPARIPQAAAVRNRPAR